MCILYKNSGFTTHPSEHIRHAGEVCRWVEEECDRKMQKERSHFTPSSIIFTVGVADFGFCTFLQCGVGVRGGRGARRACRWGSVHF